MSKCSSKADGCHCPAWQIGKMRLQRQHWSWEPNPWLLCPCPLQGSSLPPFTMPRGNASPLPPHAEMRGKHSRLQRYLGLGPGGGQEAEEAEQQRRDGPAPHPPCANHQRGDQPAGRGGSLLFLPPQGGPRTVPAMLQARHPEEWPHREAAPCPELQRLRNPLPAP